MRGAEEGELSPEGGKKVPSTIMVVEDEVLVRMLIADRLRGAGYTVIEAAHAHEAAEVLRVTPVDLVLSDIRMPGSMDGIALARLLRSQYPAVKIVLTSGHLSEAGWAEHDGFFRKPYNADEIIKHVKSLIG